MTANKVSIERLKELEAKATPGPWKFVNYNGYDQWGSLLNKRAGTADSWDSLSTGRVHTANALFIAEMRNALPALLAVVEAAEADMEANIHNDIPVCPRLRAALEALEMSNKPSNNLSNKLEDR